MKELEEIKNKIQNAVENNEASIELSIDAIQALIHVIEKQNKEIQVLELISGPFVNYEEMVKFYDKQIELRNQQIQELQRKLEKREWGLKVIKFRTQYYPEFEQFHIIAKQALEEK